MDSIKQHKLKENVNKCRENLFKFKGDLNSVLKEIRYRNKINTSLEQLFERTLHLNEWIDCKVYYKDGRVINCLEIDGLVEIFDGSNFYGKCFVYFNRDYSELILKIFQLLKKISLNLN
jgi:hypothetical protein